MIQKINEIKSLINNINEKIEKVDASLIDENKTRISLIINNLKSTIENADKKLLISLNLENVKKYLDNINNNIKSNYWNSNDSYLYEIIKEIAYLNNCNGKQNLQGYSNAVNKNIELLETKITLLINQLKDATENSKEKENKFNLSVNEMKNKIDKDYALHNGNINDLKKKYDNELLTLRKNIDEFKNSLLNDKNKISSDSTEQLNILSKKIDDEILKLNEKNTLGLTDLQNRQNEELTSLRENINSFKEEKETKINKLVKLAEEQLGYVGQATYSTMYKDYADKYGRAANWWHFGAILSMVALIVVSIFWFVIKSYSSVEYLSLIARVIATVGIAGIAKYCSSQAFRDRKLETKLRKVQLQMASFDSFTATLKEAEQNKLKIELTELLIHQKDWLIKSENDIDIVNDFVKIMKNLGHEVNIIKIDKTEESENIKNKENE